jgi:hypothetical protein
MQFIYIFGAYSIYVMVYNLRWVDGVSSVW